MTVRELANRKRLILWCLKSVKRERKGKEEKAATSLLIVEWLAAGMRAHVIAISHLKVASFKISAALCLLLLNIHDIRAECNDRLCASMSPQADYHCLDRVILTKLPETQLCLIRDVAVRSLGR
jgi:hypothetical protein